MPDNRELAALIWLGIGLVWALSQQKIRSAFGDGLRAFFKPIIFLPLLVMLAYIGLEIWLGLRLGFWNAGLVKGTVIWAVASAAVLYFNAASAAGDPRFFRKTLAATVGVVVFVEFFVNLFVMPLWAEFFILQPLLAGLAVLAAVAGFREEHRPLKNVFETLLALLGVAVFVFAAWQLYTNWPSLDRSQTVRKLLLPIWLTFGLLPLLYVMSLYVNYDCAWRAINWAAPDRRARWRARLALISGFHFRRRALHRFSPHWCRQLAQAPSYAEARRVISDFRKQEHEAAQRAAEEEERLRRYAGVDGTDSDGRRLDRREFKETMDALVWLHTCQMGWYRNHEASYRPDLLDIITDFTYHGLPHDHGITLRVASDGRSWYAWRRTVTGWCFAIGAAGPPPDQWEFDGPDPPDGFPGQDPAWGSAPLARAANRNWYYATSASD
jgi:hypothetical protein